ncbi:hypothetical protein ACJX0J_032817, partial [Zea mays]
FKIKEIIFVSKGDKQTNEEITGLYDTSIKNIIKKKKEGDDIQTHLRSGVLYTAIV